MFTLHLLAEFLPLRFHDIKVTFTSYNLHILPQREAWLT